VEAAFLFKLRFRNVELVSSALSFLQIRMATLSALSAVHLQLAYNSLLRLKSAMGQRDSGEDQRIPASELRHAHHCLVRLQKTLTEATEAGADRASDGFGHGLDAMISAVELELDEFQVRWLSLASRTCIPCASAHALKYSLCAPPVRPSTWTRSPG
jgi:hypothetical protein